MLTIPEESSDSPPREKPCNKCGVVQPLTAFHKQKSLPDGHKCYCKSCCKVIDAQRHVEKRDADNAKMRAAYAANKPEHLARAKKWYAENREQALSSVAAWQSANPEKVQEIKRRSSKKRYAEDPEPKRETWRRRHAKKKATSVVPFALADLEAKCAYWGNRCWICRGPREAIDHVKPLDKGGYHILANLRPICRACNTRKKNQWPYPNPTDGASAR